MTLCFSSSPRAFFLRWLLGSVHAGGVLPCGGSRAPFLTTTPAILLANVWRRAAEPLRLQRTRATRGRGCLAGLQVYRHRCLRRCRDACGRPHRRGQRGAARPPCLSLCLSGTLFLSCFALFRLCLCLCLSSTPTFALTDSRKEKKTRPGRMAPRASPRALGLASSARWSCRCVFTKRSAALVRTDVVHCIVPSSSKFSSSSPALFDSWTDDGRGPWLEGDGGGRREHARGCEGPLGGP